MKKPLKALSHFRTKHKHQRQKKRKRKKGKRKENKEKDGRRRKKSEATQRRKPARAPHTHTNIPNPPNSSHTHKRKKYLLLVLLPHISPTPFRNKKEFSKSKGMKKRISITLLKSIDDFFDKNITLPSPSVLSPLPPSSPPARSPSHSPSINRKSQTTAKKSTPPPVSPRSTRFQVTFAFALILPSLEP